MDPPKYYDDSLTDFINLINQEITLYVPEKEEAYPVLVTDDFYDEPLQLDKPVELFLEKPINVSPSRVKVNERPAPEAKVRKEVIKQKRKKWNGKVKRRKKARKYRGKCPSF